MPLISRVQKNKNALAGVMRIVPEGTLGAWSVLVLPKFCALLRSSIGQETIPTNVL